RARALHASPMPACLTGSTPTAPSVEIEPDGAVGVDPVRQAGIGDACKALALVVVEQLGLAPAVDQQIFVPVAVVVAPDGAHAHAIAGPVQIGDAHLLGHVLEGAVALVAIESITAPLAAVDDVEVRPAVAVEVDDRYRRAHRG